VRVNYVTNKSLRQGGVVTNTSNIFERLKQSRKDLHLSQEAIAEKCGVKRETWSRYESGLMSPGMEVLSAFAAAGADVQYILTGKHAEPWWPEPDSKDEALTQALLDRIRVVMADEGQLTARELATEIGEKTHYLDKVMDGALPLSALTLVKLVLHKEVDANWLLRVNDESKPADEVRTYNPLKPSYLSDEEKEQLEASRQNLKPRQISLLNLFDTLSERQQQVILSITEEKDRLNRLDSLMTEYMKTINKGD
jgi:transcriptional regulator with XRE-family HTH domain